MPCTTLLVDSDEKVDEAITVEVDTGSVVVCSLVLGRVFPLILEILVVVPGVVPGVVPVLLSLVALLLVSVDLLEESSARGG